MPGDNALHKAAHKGDLEECKKYVEGLDGEDKIDINEPGASDRRALHRSAGAGHLELCQYFIEHGAEIDLVSLLLKYFSVTSLLFETSLIYYLFIPFVAR